MLVTALLASWGKHAVLHPQFSDSLNRIWCYYESFLGQTQLLNVEPLRELANMFNNLKVSSLTDITNNAKILYRHKQNMLPFNNANFLTMLTFNFFNNANICCLLLTSVHSSMLISEL